MIGPPTLPPSAPLHDTQAILENEKLNYRGGGWWSFAIAILMIGLAALGLMQFLFHFLS